MYTIPFITSKYQTLTTEEAVYVMPYKLISDIPAHTTDILTAEATFSDASITPDMITFKTKDGVKIPATWKDNIATLELKKKFDYVVEEVVASVRPKDSTQQYTIAGACNIVHAASAAIDPINISLVPIAGGAVSDQVVQQVKELYQQVGVQLDIRVETPLDIPSNAWDRDGNNVLDIGDSNMLAHYTEEERAIYTYYKQQRSTDKKRYYIFVVGASISISDTAVQGFMPLKRQYGFVFAPTNPVKTIAHELGHGIFGLKHPWDTYDTTKGSTNWLMDNGQGTLLTHMDWKKIHAPALELYMFQDDEDGEQATITDIAELREFANPDGTYTFIARSGKPITVPSDISEVIFSTGDSEICPNDPNNSFRVKPFGTLTSFVSKGKRYTAAWQCKAQKFVAYKASEKETYIDTKTNSTINEAIIGFPAVSNGAIVFKVGKVSIEPTAGGNNYTASGDYQAYDFLSQRIKEVKKYNEIVAKFTPNYDAEVRQFIIDNVAKEGFDGITNYDNDAYVFIHATQLQKYDILKGCFKKGVPGRLLDLIVKSRYNKVGDVVDTTPIFSEGHEENPSLYDAKSLINHWKQYNLNYYPIVAEELEKFDFVDSLSENDLIEGFRKILDINYENVTSDNWDCFFEKIGFDTLTVVLKVLAQKDDWGNETENLLLKIFALADNNQEREQILLDILRDSNQDQVDDFTLLYRIINVTNDWASNNNPQYADIVGYITKWLLRKTSSEQFIDTIRDYEQRKNAIPYDAAHVSKADVVPMAMNNMFGLAGTHKLPYKIVTKLKEKIDIHVKTGTVPGGEAIQTTFKNTYTPYEYVVIDVWKEFSIAGRTIEKGYKVVPSVFVHWLATNINGRNNEALLRVVAEALTIVTIPFTGGTSSILLTLDATLAAGDIVFTVANNVDNESLLGNEAFFKTWTAIYGVYNLRHLHSIIQATGRGGKALFTYVSDIKDAKYLRKLIFKPENVTYFLEEFRKLSVEQRLDVIFKLDELAIAIKNAQRLNDVSRRILYRSLIKLKTELNTSFKTATPVQIVIEGSSIPYAPNLAIRYKNKLIGLGQLALEEDKTLSLVSSTKWLPTTVTNTRDIAEIPKVLTSVNGAKKLSTLQIVEDVTDGQLYLKLAASFTVDITKYQTDELLKIRDRINPAGLTHNCFTCAVKYQNEVTKGSNTVIQHITENYKNGAPAEEVGILIKNVFGADNVKQHNLSFTHEELTGKLQDIHQESVILLGMFKEFRDDRYGETTHHVFNARRTKDRQWEIIDTQEGAVYDKDLIEKAFTSVEIFEILYQDHTYISRNILKRDLPSKVHDWIDQVPESLLTDLEALPVDKLQQLVTEFENTVDALFEFNKDVQLLRVWKAMEKRGIDVRIRTDIAALKKAKPIICK